MVHDQTDGPDPRSNENDARRDRAPLFEGMKRIDDISRHGLSGDGYEDHRIKSLGEDVIARRVRWRRRHDHGVVHRLRRVQHAGKCRLGQKICRIGAALANGYANEVAIPVSAANGHPKGFLRIGYDVLELEVVTAVFSEVRWLAVIGVNEESPAA